MNKFQVSTIMEYEEFLIWIFLEYEQILNFNKF
jgi:hypothetical protein